MKNVSFSGANYCMLNLQGFFYLFWGGKVVHISTIWRSKKFKPNPTQPSEASSPLKAPGHHPFPLPARASPLTTHHSFGPRGFTHFPESPANSALTQFLGVRFGLVCFLVSWNGYKLYEYIGCEFHVNNIKNPFIGRIWCYIIGGGFLNICFFAPRFCGKWSNLTTARYFQIGWN